MKIFLLWFYYFSFLNKRRNPKYHLILVMDNCVKLNHRFKNRFNRRIWRKYILNMKNQCSYYRKSKLLAITYTWQLLLHQPQICQTVLWQYVHWRMYVTTHEEFNIIHKQKLMHVKHSLVTYFCWIFPKL